MKELEQLKSMNLELPKPSVPGGNYTSVNVRGNIAYVAIQFPIIDQQHQYQGLLGQDWSTEDGYKAMQVCALNILAQINAKVGVERLEGLNHIDAYYRSVADWDEAPTVVDGASELFIKVLGDKGIHSRAIFGVQQLPRNFCVGLTSSFTLLK
jgi:enamine deaminase RidA (YjgF/YER057c/UK114 family)